MKVKTTIIISVLFFFSLLFYLHQKVLVYIEAYKLTKNYRILNELVDKRDYLVYNLNKETSVPKINQWAEKNSFAPAHKLLAINLKRKENLRLKRDFVSLLSNLLGIPTASSTALAKEKK
jgi:hypothetical protein